MNQIINRAVHGLFGSVFNTKIMIDFNLLRPKPIKLCVLFPVSRRSPIWILSVQASLTYDKIALEVFITLNTKFYIPFFIFALL